MTSHRNMGCHGGLRDHRSQATRDAWQTPLGESPNRRPTTRLKIHRVAWSGPFPKSRVGRMRRLRKHRPR